MAITFVKVKVENTLQPEIVVVSEQPKLAPNTDSILTLKSADAKSKKFYLDNGVVTKKSFNIGGGVLYDYSFNKFVGIVQTSDFLKGLETKPNEFILFDELREEHVGVPKIQATYHYKTEAADGKNQIGYTQPKVGGSYLWMVDFDSLPLPDGLNLITHTQAALEYGISLLDECFHDVCYHYQLSSSSGMENEGYTPDDEYGLAQKGTTLTAHCFFWFSEPQPAHKMKTWANNTNAKWQQDGNEGKLVDPSIYYPAHITYTAVPLFDGVTDPFPTNRSGLVQKQFDKVIFPKTIETLQEAITYTSTAECAEYGGDAPKFKHKLACIGDHKAGNGTPVGKGLHFVQFGAAKQYAWEVSTHEDHIPTLVEELTQATLHATWTAPAHTSVYVADHCTDKYLTALVKKAFCDVNKKKAEFEAEDAAFEAQWAEQAAKNAIAMAKYAAEHPTPLLTVEKKAAVLGNPQGKYIVDAKEYRKQGAVSWAIKGILPYNSFGFVFGVRGSFKSFIALNLASAIIYAHDWCGYTNKVKNGRVLYIVAEGHGGFPSRLAALTQQFGDWPDGSFHLVTRAVDFSNDTDAKAILAESGHLENPYNLVIFDTMSRISGDIDKNTDAVNKIISNMEIFKTPVTAVMALAHPPKNNPNTISGKFEQENAADFMFRITREDKAMSAKFYVEKQKDGEDGFELDMKLTKVQTYEAATPDEDDLYSFIVEHDSYQYKELNTLGKILLQINIMQPVGCTELADTLTKDGIQGCQKQHLNKRLTKEMLPDVIPEGKTKNDYCTNSIKQYVDVLTNDKIKLKVYSLNKHGEDTLIAMQEACCPKTHQKVEENEQE